MRSALLLVAALATPAMADQRYISIGADALPEASTIAGQPLEMNLVTNEGDVAVLTFDDDKLDELSEAMHEKHNRCGGFMVHDTLEDAFAEALPEKPMQYTLDRADVVKAVLPEIEEKRIQQTIRELSSMKNRYYQSASGAAASVWLHDRWVNHATGRKDVTIEYMDHGYEQRSVIMTIRGTTRANEVVVIGGHLDSIAPGGFSATAPGADDDASGISTLDEVARVLLNKDFRPERTIKFMAYAAEEVGLRGSLSIVREFKKQKVNVVGALQLDMTNYQGSNKDIWLIKDYTSAAQNNFLVSLIETYTTSTWGWDQCGYACSDHASWHRAGVPASMPFEARFRESNKSIHTAKDTLERSNENAEHAVKFARLAAAYAIELGKGELHGQATMSTARSCGEGGCNSWKWLAGLSSLAIAFALWFRTSRVG
ncbi:MAG: M20/M25/M40 family metallo-hydrolase [Myxococcota bacterium]|nr:M20/M25/M40 family metallo-hydrolase [Myxococcota bacterium]